MKNLSRAFPLAPENAGQWSRRKVTGTQPFEKYSSRWGAAFGWKVWS